MRKAGYKLKKASQLKGFLADFEEVFYPPKVSATRQMAAQNPYGPFGPEPRNQFGPRGPGPSGFGTTGQPDKLGQYPPGQLGQFPPGQYPPGQYPPGQYPPGQYPPAGQNPYDPYAQGQYPPGQASSSTNQPVGLLTWLTGGALVATPQNPPQNPPQVAGSEAQSKSLGVLKHDCTLTHRTGKGIRSRGSLGPAAPAHSQPQYARSHQTGPDLT